MNSPIRAFFGGAIAVILLGLFSFSILHMISAVWTYCAAGEGTCTAPTDGPLVTDGVILLATTAGGLVSALVIAQLGATEPGSQPRVGSYVATTEQSAKATTWIILLYLAAWIVTGLAALIVGCVLYPKVLQTLSDIGTTWLGLAVTAAYAYFGISPSTVRENDKNAAGN